MKKYNKSVITAIVSLAISNADAALFAINNTDDLQTDTLYANEDNSPMSGGIVTLGYFGPLVTDADVDTIPELVSLLGSFTVLSSAIPGAPMTLIGGLGIPGYANNGDIAVTYGDISSTSNETLLQRRVYSIVTNAANLSSASLSSSFAVVRLANLIRDDDDITGGEYDYSSDPKGLVPLIGTTGSSLINLGIDFDGPGGDPALPASTYNTLRLASIPEPSATLLGVLGVCSLLRRRR